MKKLPVLSLILFFFLQLSGETLYYYADGKKIELEEDFSSYSFIRTTLTKANFVMPQGVKTLKQHQNVSIIETGDDNAVKTLKKSGILFPAYRKKEGGKVYAGNQIFVKIPGKPSGKNAEKWCEKHGMKLIKQYKYAPEWYLVSVSENPIKKAAALVDSKISEAAEPDFFISLKKRAYTPNDPLFKKQWHLNNDSSNHSVSGNDHAHVAEAWEILKTFRGNTGGDGIKLAVIDDGFDLDHEDLSEQFIAGYDFNGKDDDPSYENEYDWHGNIDPDYSDRHGTCCAGVAAAAADNGKGVAGACPNCKIIPIRIDFGSSKSLSSIGLDAFEWAADAGADIMSNSWGPADREGPEDMSTPLKNLVENLVSYGRDGKGIIILFAAGNGGENIDAQDSRDGFAGNPYVFAIGATNASGIRSYYSDFGESLDFMAPSGDLADDGYGDLIDGIWTTDNSDYSGYNPGNSYQGDKNGDYTNDFNGTSSACPLAAGITGLVLSANPDLTIEDVYGIYAETSDKVGNRNYSNGFNEYYGYGRINACKAVKKALEIAGEDLSQVTCNDNSDTGDTVDPGDSDDSGDPTDSGDSADSTDTADSADSGNSSDSTDSGDISDSSDSADSGESNNTDTGTNENAVCGNNLVEGDEECDDGNTINGDGCSKYCMLENGNKTKKSKSDGCSAIVL